MLMLRKNTNIGFTVLRLSQNQLFKFSTETEPKFEDRDEG